MKQHLLDTGYTPHVAYLMRNYAHFGPENLFKIYLRFNIQSGWPYRCTFQFIEEGGLIGKLESDVTGCGSWELLGECVTPGVQFDLRRPLETGGADALRMAMNELLSNLRRAPHLRGLQVHMRVAPENPAPQAARRLPGVHVALVLTGALALLIIRELIK